MSSEVNVDYRECVYPVPYVSLRIDEQQPIEASGVKQLLKRIRPDWPTEHIQFKVLLFNLVNILLHIFTEGRSSRNLTSIIAETLRFLSATTSE